MSGRYNYAEKGKKQAREDMKGSMEFVLHIFKFTRVLMCFLNFYNTKEGPEDSN